MEDEPEMRNGREYYGCACYCQCQDDETLPCNYTCCGCYCECRNPDDYVNTDIDHPTSNT